MWRFVFLAVLGFTIGSVARSERGVVLLSFLFGLLYGGVELMTITMAIDKPSPERALVIVGLGLVMGLPVYAMGEIWRRTHTRIREWLRRLK